MDIEIIKVDLPLKSPFAISGGSAEIKTNFLVVMDGRYCGEAAGSVAYGPSEDEIATALATGVELLQQIPHLRIGTLSEISSFPIDATARAALTGMVHNFLSGEAKKHPWELLSLDAPAKLHTSLTVAIDKPSQMVEKIKGTNRALIKIKLGGEDDSTVIAALGDISGKTFRVDANGAWSCEQAEEMIHLLAQKGVRMIEQPTTEEFVPEWPRLKGRHKDVELIIDEGLNEYEDLARCEEFVDGVNIKMEKCGGILEGIRIAKRAHDIRRKVLLGCMVTSSVGIAPSTYMSSLADYWDLDGPLLLQEDIATGLDYDNELIRVDRDMIGGPELKREVVEKYIRN